MFIIIITSFGVDKNYRIYLNSLFISCIITVFRSRGTRVQLKFRGGGKINEIWGVNDNAGMSRSMENEVTHFPFATCTQYYQITI